MKIQDFCDMDKFEQIMKNWASSTGLATVAVGADGKYISDCYNFTEFCIDLTRGSAEGKKRCEQCDREGHGVYPCHAGLVDFGIPITLEDGTVLGSIIGGQVLPENPDEEKFRQTARELGIDEDKYIKALKKVNVKTREQIDASANLLGDVINMFVRASYVNRKNENLVGELKGGITKAAEQIEEATDKTKEIDGYSKRQQILALNASIEAARAGDQGKGFAVVADEVRNLATKSDQAAKATKELIDRSITSVQRGSEIVKKVSDSLDKTVDAAENVMGVIQDIAKAAEEEAEAISQVREGIDQISSVVQTNSATSEESAAASEELSSQAALMKELLAKFKLRSTDDVYSAAGKAEFRGEEPAEVGGAASAFSKY